MVKVMRDMINYHGTGQQQLIHAEELSICLSVLSLCCKVHTQRSCAWFASCSEGGEEEAWHKTATNNLYQECSKIALALSTTVPNCTAGVHTHFQAAAKFMSCHQG